MDGGAAGGGSPRGAGAWESVPGQPGSREGCCWACVTWRVGSTQECLGFCGARTGPHGLGAHSVSWSSGPGQTTGRRMKEGQGRGSVWTRGLWEGSHFEWTEAQVRLIFLKVGCGRLYRMQWFSRTHVLHNSYKLIFMSESEKVSFLESPDLVILMTYMH